MRISEEVGRLVPQSDDAALLRGLLIGVAVGATIAGLLILGQTLQKRRAGRPGASRLGPPPPEAPAGPEPSPL
jgi:hypothetical protein